MPDKTIRELQAMLQEVLQHYHRKRLAFAAILGDGNGNVEVEGRSGFVYYRLVEDDKMYGIALNRRVPNREDLPVIIGYDIHQPYTLQVLSVRQVYSGTGQTLPAEVGPHHETHEYEPPGTSDRTSGDDVVWVHQQQMTPLLCKPTDPETMTVEISAGSYGSREGFAYYTGTTTADLSSYKPTSGSSARFVALSIDVKTNILQYTEGDTFGIISPPSNFFAYVPELPVECVPVAAILLTSSLTEIGWDQIYDIRTLNNAIRDGAEMSLSIVRLERDLGFLLSRMRMEAFNMMAIQRLEKDVEAMLAFVQMRQLDYLFVPASGGRNATDGTALTIGSDGFQCPDSKLCYVYGWACVPASISVITARAVVVGQGNGDVYAQNFFAWGACGTAQGGYDETTGYSAVTVASGENSCILSTELSDEIAAGVIVNCQFARNATHGDDTLAANCNIKGWIFTLS